MSSTQEESEGEGGRSLPHASVLKTLDSTLTCFLCILHSPTAGWWAIFTRGSRLESPGDVSAAAFGASRIQNAAMPRINWFFFNAPRRLLTERETAELAARMSRRAPTFSESTCDPLWYHLLIKWLTGSTYENTHESKRKRSDATECLHIGQHGQHR